jgi:hypothetical protein
MKRKAKQPDRTAQQAEAEAHTCKTCGTRGWGGWNCYQCGSHDIEMGAHQ